MSYCTHSHVASEFKGVDFAAAGAKVNSTEVGNFIAETSLAIDAYLSKRYEVPIIEGTSPNAFVFLRGLCRQIVAARVAPILNVSIKVNVNEESKNQRSQASSIWRRIKDISEGKADLPSDATFKTESTSSRFHVECGEANRFDA